jgi:1-acyl-sn-glycerol-3-phosphate acyltransferase
MPWRKFTEELGRTALASAVLLPLILLCSLAAVVQSAWGAQPSQVDWVYQILSRAFVWVSGAALIRVGTRHVVAGQAYVVVSNHESNLDPFAIMWGLPELVIRFVIKRQLARIPLFGQALERSGNVIVERQGRGDMRRVQEALAHRDPRVSLLFFAEGTRAKDGRLQPFKKGAFASAIDTGLPVLPVGIAGSYYVMQPGRWWLRRGGIAIEVGRPLPVDASTQRDALHEETFAAVAKLRAEARAALRAAGIEPGGRD